MILYYIILYYNCVKLGAAFNLLCLFSVFPLGANVSTLIDILTSNF